MSALGQILSPLDKHVFLREHWARQPVHVRGHAAKFADLFGWPSFDRYLNHHLRFFAPPALELYDGRRGGGRIPAELFQESIVDANRCSLTVSSPARIRELCRAGASLMLRSVDDGDPQIKRFAAALGHELGENLRVDLFYTPPESPGVHQHYDREDVLVLQVEGEKEWHLSAPTVRAPLDMPDYAELARAPVYPDHVFRLSKGDFLHVPRGVWHAAQTSGGPSLHLTVRVACRTGIDFLRWALAELAREEPSLRENLPLTLQAGAPYGYEPAALGEAVARIRGAALAFLERPDLVARYNKDCVKGDRAAEPYQLRAQAGVRGADAAWTEETAFRRPPGQRFVLERCAARDVAILSVWGAELDFPLSAAALLESIFSRDRFSGRELASGRGGAAWAEAAPVLARLVAAGVVFVVEPGGASLG
ncbi:MAG TPA: cupin domain-containing protein [Sorangium sp.]|nr:cupin domain-containing protein [Sorangium sp.]